MVSVFYIEVGGCVDVWMIYELILLTMKADVREGIYSASCFSRECAACRYQRG